MYGTMWSLDIRFDTRLFTVSYVVLSYTQQSSVNYFNYAIRDLLNYMAAQKRIRVSNLHSFFSIKLTRKLSIGISFT